jgi:tape measure domain-containing protein
MAVMVSANSSGFTAGFASMSNTLGGFISQIGKLGSVVGITTGIGEGIKSMFGGAAEMESNAVAFETLLGSAEKAKVLMGDLAKFGAETPFQLPELTKAGKSLAAFGMDADEIVPKLRRIGDISALLNQPIGEMATLYGKAKVAGVLMSEDINQFTERGVPLIQALASQFGVAEVQVKKLASEGKISFGDLDKAITSMTSAGGRFAGGSEKQSKTIGGMWSTLTDNVGVSLTKLGEGLLTVFSGKDAIGGLISFTGTIQESVASWAESIGGFVPYVQMYFETLGSYIGAVWEGVRMAFDLAWASIGLVFEGIGASTLNFKEIFIDSMLNVQYFFKNFSSYWELGWESVKLTMSIAGNDIVHLFTVNIPEVLSWFSRQWKNVFTDIYNMTTTIFSNIGKNIVEFFKNIPGLIAGTTSLADIWTPLTDGFKTSITESLSVTKREFTQWEKEAANRIRALDQSLGQGRDAFVEKGKADFASKLAGANATVAAAATSPSSTPGGSAAMAAAIGKGQEWKRSGAIEAGSKEAYNVVMRSRDFNSPAQKTSENTTKLVKAADKQTTLLESMEESITSADTDFVADFGGGASY